MSEFSDRCKEMRSVLRMEKTYKKESIDLKRQFLIAIEIDKTTGTGGCFY